MDHDRFFYVQMDWYRIILVFGVFCIVLVFGECTRFLNCVWIFLVCVSFSMGGVCLISRFDVGSVDIEAMGHVGGWRWSFRNVLRYKMRMFNGWLMSSWPVRRYQESSKISFTKLRYNSLRSLLFVSLGGCWKAIIWRLQYLI